MSGIIPIARQITGLLSQVHKFQRIIVLIITKGKAHNEGASLIVYIHIYQAYLYSLFFV